MTFIFRTLVLVLLAAAANAQSVVPEGQSVLNGYTRTVSGERLSYFSIYPDYAKEALLTRCTDGKMAIEWETAPAIVSGQYVYFSWIAAHSSGTSKGTRHFDLYINDKKALTFTTQARQYPPVWSFDGPEGVRLSFELKTRDGADDSHGIAYLRVPAAWCTPGAPLRVRVTGQNQGSTDWYMTFQYTFEEKIDLEPLPFLLRGEPRQQPLQITVLHFGPPDTLYLRVQGGPEHRFPVQNGAQTFEAAFLAVDAPVSIPVSARIGNRLVIERSVQLRPVTYRELHLVHHAHTDIGYSHYQEEVARIHTQNIRQALVLIEKTKNYPEGSRFIWNIESLWAVENFLREATPTEQKQFVRAAHAGQIGLSGVYANILTGLCNPEELRWWTEYADTLRARYKLAIRAAMFSDIPGLTWETVPALAAGGIRYLSNGPNYVESLPDHGDRIGSTLRDLGDRPFWWKSASGQDSVLVWTCGKGYSSWHGVTPGAVFARGPKKIAAYLNELDASGYPYDMVQWRYNIVADNGPVDSTIADFVRQWNARYETPVLSLDNVSEVFECFEQEYGKKIPVYQGDFTPYWEDGAYSTAAEEAENRQLSNKLIQLQHLAKQTGDTDIPADWWYAAKRHILLFHEHTWGAWNSISQPDDPFVTRQWDYKKRLLDSARYEIQRLETRLLPVAGSKTRVVVANTLPWARSSWVEIAWPAKLRANALRDEQGNIIPVQKLANGNRLFIARDVPANSTKTYTPIHTQEKLPLTFTPFQILAFDPATGAVSQVMQRERDWVNPYRYGGMLQALYVPGLNPDSLLLPVAAGRQVTEAGPVLLRTRSTGALAGTNGVVYEISQYEGLPVLHLAVEIQKKPVREKESLHVAFPFALGGPTVRFGAGDAWYTPEKMQIPGANHDYFSAQRWLDVSTSGAGVTLSCPQGALFELGKPVDERRLNKGYKQWLPQAEASPTVFLYAGNNYWHTNYKADQQGRIRYDFYLHFHRGFNGDMAARWGKEAAEGLIGRWE